MMSSAFNDDSGSSDIAVVFPCVGSPVDAYESPDRSARGAVSHRAKRYAVPVFQFPQINSHQVELGVPRQVLICQRKQRRLLTNGMAGLRSFLSICSRPRIQWVARKSKSCGTSLSDSARAFTIYITRRLKIERRLSTARILEPDLETSWAYVRGKCPDRGY
jgi:hypothetical protein